MSVVNVIIDVVEGKNVSELLGVSLNKQSFGFTHSVASKKKQLTGKVKKELLMPVCV